MGEDFDFIINTNKIEVKHLRMLKVRQSIESIFVVIFFFTIMTTIGDQLVDKSSQQITEMKKAVETGAREEIPFDNTLKIGDINKIDTTKIIKVARGETIYSIFKKEGLLYSDENLERIKLLNPNIKTLKKLKIGMELVFPITENKVEKDKEPEKRSKKKTTKKRRR